MKKLLTKTATLVIITVLICTLVGCANTGFNKEPTEPKVYDVISVSQYVKTTTNNFGGVINQKPVYTFTYIDGSGELRIVDDFENLEYGLTKVKVGESNQYVVEDNGLDTYRTLYLTKETLKETTITDAKE